MSIRCGEFLSRKYTILQSNGSEHSFGSFKLSGETISIVCFKPPLYLAAARRRVSNQQQAKSKPLSKECAHCQENDSKCQCDVVFPVFYVFIEGATDGSISRDEINHCYKCMREYDEWDSTKARQWYLYSKIALVCPYCEKDEPVSLVGWFCMEICVETPMDADNSSVGTPILPVLFPSSNLPRILHKDCYTKLAKEALSVGCKLPTSKASNPSYESPIERFFDRGFMDEIMHALKRNLMQFEPPKGQFTIFVPYSEGPITEYDYRALGNEAMKLKDYNNAVILYGNGIRHNGADFKLYSNRAAAYSALKNHEGAYKDALKCTQKEPKWVKGHYRKALALNSLGRKEEAVEATLFALTLEPNNLEVANLLVQTEIKKGETNIKKMIDIIEEYSKCRYVHLFLSIVCQNICDCVGIDTRNEEVQLNLNKKKPHENPKESLTGEDAIKVANLICDYGHPAYLDSFVSGFICYAEHEISRLKQEDSSNQPTNQERIKAIDDDLRSLIKKRSKDDKLLYTEVKTNSGLGSMFENFKIKDKEVADIETNGTSLKKGKSKVCATCGRIDVKLRKCGNCLKVYYCSRDCQSENWKIHKKDCSFS